MGIVNAIIENLKKGSIQNIALFSDTETLMEPPYIIIKPESGTIPNTRQFRILVHHNEGYFSELEKYVLEELNELLLPRIKDTQNNYYKLFSNGYEDIMADTDDNTYIMERIFYTPLWVGN